MPWPPRLWPRAAPGRDRFLRSFYEPDIRSADPIPVKLGLLSARPPQNVRYGVSVDYQLDIRNYISALQDELRSKFFSVRLLQKPEECPECSLFAYSSLTLHINHSLNTYNVRLRVDFYYPDNTPLITLSSRTEGAASPDASLQWQTAINGATGFMLAGPTIDRYGAFITNVSVRAISELVEDIGAKAKNEIIFRKPRQDRHAPKAMPASL